MPQAKVTMPSILSWTDSITVPQDSWSAPTRLVMIGEPCRSPVTPPLADARGPTRDRQRAVDGCESTRSAAKRSLLLCRIDMSASKPHQQENGNFQIAHCF